MGDGKVEGEEPVTVAFFSVKALRQQDMTSMSSRSGHELLHCRLWGTCKQPPLCSCAAGAVSSHLHRHISRGTRATTITQSLRKQLPNGEELPNLNTYCQRDKKWQPLRKEVAGILTKNSSCTKNIKPKQAIQGSLPHIYSPPRLQSEKAMAPHSSTLAWKIPRMEEPGRLQSMGSLRVRHD